MQAFNQQYDYGKRAEYQVARLETTYLKKGDSWEKAPTVYQITVLDFNYTPKSGDKPAVAEASDSNTGTVAVKATMTVKANDSSANVEATATTPVSRYAMRTKDGRELANALNVIFIELPKAAGLEAQVDKNSPIENWAIFLKDADDPQKRDVIKQLTAKEAGLMQAQKSLSNISANRELWLAQYRQEVKERDWRSGMAVAERRGIARGRAEGRTEGKRSAKVETALSMLADGVPIAQVAKWTGLSFEELAKL